MIYTICKGCHYSNGIVIGSPHTGKTFQEYLVKFSRECLVLPGTKNCDGDWNKLFGWGYGLHQRNSLRLVWKSLNGKIRIGWYVYESGVRKYDGFASVEAEASTIMSITHDPASKNVLFKCGDKSVTIPYATKPSWGYNLNPYYGGDCSAPETMTIELL